MFCIQYDRQTFTPIQTTHKITVLYISKFIYFDGKWGHKIFWTEVCSALLDFSLIHFFFLVCNKCWIGLSGLIISDKNETFVDSAGFEVLAVVYRGL
jgi:hypothetical protein